ncbi:MAG: uracil-DNA glycosylase [Geminicoccaceae bacterium]|nr:uracil-DNA glycosylase [Geminicoccaceae bacterium]
MEGTDGPGRACPSRDCPSCPRLVTFRLAQRAREPDWHNAPVPAFGPFDARLLVVGLAPGLKGANRTGRPFTGDHAGIVLYDALARHGFSRGTFEARPDDGLELVDCRIVNAVRCVPPQNKPNGAEIAACRRFLVDHLVQPPRPLVVLTLGRVAHTSTLRALGLRERDALFAHGAHARPGDGPHLLSSYHCSRYNMNTGRLTVAMFDTVVRRAADLLGAA